MRAASLLLTVFLLASSGVARGETPEEELSRSPHAGFECVACHRDDASRRIPKQNVPDTCGGCHAEVLEEYRRSIHGLAVERGVFDAPSCTDCHGEHDILPAIEDLSRVYPANIARTTCPQCHANERIIAKYNLPGERVETFRDTYHGLAGRAGDVAVANCASCHGIHKILPSTDPESSIHPRNLAATCGRCHPNANENFTRGSVHRYDNRGVSGRVIRFITWFYLILIPLVAGLLLARNLLDYSRKLIAVYQHRRQEPSFARMNLQERIQHGVLMASFCVLVLTGFALKFGWPLPGRAVIHRVAGVLLLVDLAYHLAYILLTKRGRDLVRNVLPRLADLGLFRADWKHLAFGKPRPAFGLFAWWEKLEYWSVIWGTVVMGVTGLLLWFENWSLGFLPKWGLDVATLIHYLEAILATLAIVVGHFYFVILNPEVFPMSFTWLNGRIPRDQARSEHPQVYGDREEEGR